MGFDSSLYIKWLASPKVGLTQLRSRDMVGIIFICIVFSIFFFNSSEFILIQKQV